MDLDLSLGDVNLCQGCGSKKQKVKKVVLSPAEVDALTKKAEFLVYKATVSKLSEVEQIKELKRLEKRLRSSESTLQELMRRKVLIENLRRENVGK